MNKDELRQELTEWVESYKDVAERNALADRIHSEVRT